MSHNNLAGSSAIVTALTAVLLPTNAGSQVLEEVVVTAQKREQSIQDVGIAITAFTGDQLKVFGFLQSVDIANFTPGVRVATTSARNNSLFAIRGSVQNDFGDVAEAPNAVYVDEAYQLAPLAQLFATYDMERVEILKGPQGTLFGRNATGGLVSFLTKAPTSEFEAFADVTYGRFDSLRIEGAIGGPVTDTLSLRLSGLRDEHDPILENTITAADLPATPAFLAAQGRGPLAPDIQGGDGWVGDLTAIRGQLLFEPNDDVALRLKGEYAKSKPGTEAAQNVATVAFVDDTDGDGVEDNVVNTVRASEVLSAGFLCEQISVNTGNCVDSALDLDFDGVRPNANGDFFGYFENGGTDDLKMKNVFSTRDSDDSEIYSVTGKLTWETGFGLLTAVSNYSHLDRIQALNINAAPVPHFLYEKESETEWFTQELRLGGETDKVNWTGGLYYLTSDTKSAQGLADMIGGINPFAGLFFNGFLTTANDYVSAVGDATLETDSYSAFGQIEYSLTDRWRFIFGLRAILEEKDYFYSSRIYPNTNDNRLESGLFSGTPPLTLPGTDIPFEFLADPVFQDTSSDFLWSGKVQLDYLPTDDLLAYASINRGIKAGSYNQPLLTVLSRDDLSYDEETLLSYEVGVKSTLIDGRARLNIAAYYYDYRDYQAFQFVGTSGAIFNADAVNKGIEAELISTPIDNLDLMLGFSYIDATIKDLLVAPNLARDVEPTFTPDTQFMGMARYTWPNALFGSAFSLQLDGRYASSSYFNINNFDAHEMDSYWVGNVRARWVSEDQRWELGAFVNNFSDERPQTVGFDLSTICGCDEYVLDMPRWWGINLRYAW
jgi:iron complex outermembrane receptor protein